MHSCGVGICTDWEFSANNLNFLHHEHHTKQLKNTEDIPDIKNNDQFIVFLFML